MNRKNAPRRGRGYFAGYLKHYTKKNNVLLFLCALFLVGVLLGTLLLRSADADTWDILGKLTSGYLSSRKDATLLQNFWSALGPMLLFLVGVFLCGFSAVSQPLEVLVPLFRGLGYGISIASLYAGYGTSAIGYVALFMLPGMVFTTLALCFCCRESLRLSGSFFAAMNGQDKGFYSLRAYLARYVTSAIVCVLAALLEAALYFVFAGFFSLG